MGARLKKETKQRQPFGGLEEEVHLNILRTGDAFLHTQEETLKPAGLTPAQSNVLRILRAVGTWGLPCREIAGRMLTRDPGITRLPSA